MTWPLVPMNGDTARTEGHSAAMAVASPSVSVITVPERTPPDWLLAGSTMMTLEPEGLKLVLHQLAAALPQRHHRRDRGDADDNAKDGEPRAQLVFAERAQGDHKQVEKVHAITSE